MIEELICKGELSRPICLVKIHGKIYCLLNPAENTKLSTIVRVNNTLHNKVVKVSKMRISLYSISVQILDLQPVNIKQMSVYSSFFS